MKYFITGNISSGKTTLAEKIGDYLDIKVFHLDEIVHDDENNKKRDEEEQKKIINKIVRENKEWIIEGTPRTHLEILCNLSETIILLDYNKEILKKRIKKRYIKRKLGLEKINYKIDKNYLKEEYKNLEKFNYNLIYEQLTKHIRKGIIIKNDKELNKLMESIYESYKY